MDCVLAVLLLSPDPPLNDRDRFPSCEVASQVLQFNRAYRRHTEARQLWERRNWWYWQEVLNETDHIYRCWDCLHDAQCGEWGDETDRRRALRRLRELLGDDAYFRGVMPPPVPIWRFVMLD